MAVVLSTQQTSSLQPGAFYRISDFKTVHYISESQGATGTLADRAINTGPTEPLIVFATSVNTLASEAHSETFPNDIIHYCIDENVPISVNELSMTDGAGNIVPGWCGYISYRRDAINNISGTFDWRNVVHRRFSADSSIPAWSGATSRGALVEYNGWIYGALMDTTAFTGMEPGGTSQAWTKLFNKDAFIFTEGSSTFPDIGIFNIPTGSSYQDFPTFYPTADHLHNVHISAQQVVPGFNGQFFIPNFTWIGTTCTPTIDTINISPVASTIYFDNSLTGSSRTSFVEADLSMFYSTLYVACPTADAAPLFDLNLQMNDSFVSVPTPLTLYSSNLSINSSSINVFYDCRAGYIDGSSINYLNASTFASIDGSVVMGFLSNCTFNSLVNCTVRPDFVNNIFNIYENLYIPENYQCNSILYFDNCSNLPEGMRHVSSNILVTGVNFTGMTSSVTATYQSIYTKEIFKNASGTLRLKYYDATDAYVTTGLTSA